MLRGNSQCVETVQPVAVGLLLVNLAIGELSAAKIKPNKSFGFCRPNCCLSGSVDPV